MSGRPMPPAQPSSRSTTVAVPQPQRICPRQVWQTLTPKQHQQVLGRLVVMCQECRLWLPPDRLPSHGSPGANETEVSHDDEHTPDAGGD
jgi:hypothetical protein